MATRTWSDFGIDIALAKGTGDERKMPCPLCSPHRRKKSYPCLNVNIDKQVFNCWHCGWHGGIGTGEQYRPDFTKPPRTYRRPTYHSGGHFPPDVLEWFHERGLTDHVLQLNNIGYGPVYFPQVEEERQAVQFPYYRNGEVVNVKYRTLDKLFRMASGAERILYGIDDVTSDQLIFVEGEIDKLSLKVAGYHSVVSVPDGAPTPDTKNYASKFDFLISAEDVLSAVKKIVIAVDADAPGRRLADELARRLGPERCYAVTWASDCKDANDVLVSYGPETLQECVEHAEPWPISGIVTVDQLRPGIDALYEQEGYEGVSPGWFNVARHYRVMPDQFTVVTGVPSHGKSTWMSALMVNLAKLHGWRFAIFSPEQLPLERYARTMIEQYVGLPLRGSNRMTREQKDSAVNWMQPLFSFLLPEEDEPATVEHLLSLAKIELYRRGINGLVLDPWNEMDHTLHSGEHKTDYISECLSRLRRFAKIHKVHVWLVAHPTKLQKALKGRYEGTYPPPTPYDIADSAHFRNKADNAITVWRDLDGESQVTEVHVQKIRFAENGTTGVVELVFDPRCRRYTDRTEEFTRRAN